MQQKNKLVSDSSEEERLRAWREERSASRRQAETTSEQPPKQTASLEVKKPLAPPKPPESPKGQDASQSERQEADRVRQWRQNRTRTPDVVAPPPPKPHVEDVSTTQVDLTAPKPRPAAVKQEKKPPIPAPVSEASPGAPLETPIASVPKVDTIEEQRQRLRRLLAEGRRKFWMGITAFALLPALLAVAYESFIAVPLYGAESVVMVAKASNVSDASAGSFLGAIGAGGGGSNISEAFMAQEYVNSEALLQDLERDLGIITQLSSDEIDPLRRLRQLDFFGISQRTQFQRFVRSSVNVQTGMMSLIVRAPSVEEVEEMSKAILARIEARINDLSEGLFAQQIKQAELTVAEARKYMLDTQSALTALQIESGEADLQLRVTGLYQGISAVEDELLGIETQIAEQSVSGRSDSFDTERLDALRSNLETRINLMRQRLLESPDRSERRPLSELLLNYQRLQLELQIGLEVLTQALVAQEQAQETAALGRSQFQIVVPPVAAKTPWRPRPLYAGLIVFLFAISAISIARLFRGR
jgi:capsule polysaccharide export protein KpsE/RkpR